jgi:hypothetical protein
VSFLAFCTFDLKNADRNDYNDAYADLEDIGLKRVVAGSKNEVVIPTTSVMGTYKGSSVESVRDYVRSKVKDAFSARGFTSEIFVVVGENGTWGSTTT